MKGLIKIVKDNGSILRIQSSKIDFANQETDKIDISVNGRIITLNSKEEMQQFLDYVEK